MSEELKSVNENIDLDKVQEIIKNHKHKGKRALIAILQDIQNVFGYLPEKALRVVSETVRIPMAKIFGVCTFYSQFRLKPLGKYVIQVCDGTACHVRGSTGLLDELQSQLAVKPGETTPDGLFSIEVVACIGACSLAPAMIVNEDTYAKLTPLRLGEIIETYRRKEKK